MSKSDTYYIFKGQPIKLHKVDHVYYTSFLIDGRYEYTGRFYFDFELLVGIESKTILPFTPLAHALYGEE